MLPPANRELPRFLGACLFAALAAGASNARPVELVPPAWNYGVRPQYHVISTVVELHSAVGESLEIGLVQIACECLKAEVLRERGSAAEPAAIRVEMYTEDFIGATKHSLFISVKKQKDLLLRFDVTGWVLPEGDSGRPEVFYSEDDPAGAGIARWCSEKGRAAPLEVRISLRPIEDVDNYKRLRTLEKSANRSGPPPDVIAFVGGRVVLSGIEDVKLGLRGLLNIDEDGAPGRLAPAPEAHSPAAVAASMKHAQGSSDSIATAGHRALKRPRLEVVLYHFSTCKRCREVIAAIEDAAATHIDQVELRIVDCEKDAQAIPRLYATIEAYDNMPRILPSVIAFVGDTALLGERPILEGVLATVEAQLTSGGSHLSVRTGAPDSTHDDVLGRIAVLPVVLAALADGVNPCAFAAMILLVSVLGTARLSKDEPASAARELAFGGGAFCFGVFLTYYLAGLAVFTAVREASAFPLIEAVLFWTVWSVAAAGAAFSLYDAITYLRGRDASKLTLKVPEFLRQRFAPVLRGRFRRYGLVIGGFVGGTVIAVLEGVCTGQMYLPTIQYMAVTPGLRVAGAAYLLLYNVLFILPLVAILLAALAGVHFHRLNALLLRHIGGAKMVLALTFAVLAVMLLIQR